MLLCYNRASASFLAEQNQKGHESLETRVEKFYMELVSMRHDLQANRSLARSSNSILTRLSGLITGDMFSQLKTLVDLAGKVWQSNMQIMSFFVNLQTSSPSPELRYTWVQEPIKFEDAMGRVIPIPSEYNWGKLEAIIMAQFDNGPGYKKICAGEYELFNTLDCSQIISRAENEVLTPGLSITMAIIIGRYHSAKSDRCPRPGCKSEEFASKESGGTICCICKACFDHAQKSLPLPLRPPEQDFVTFVPYSQRSQGLKRKRFSVLTDGEIEPQHHRKKMKTEGNMFKNFRTQLSTLAQSPIVSNVRSTGRRLKRHKSTTFQATRKASTRQQPAPQQDSAKQYTSNSPGTIPNWLEGTSSLHCRPYLLASSDQAKNKEHDPASSFQYSASNKKDPTFSPAPTVVSEPSWLAMSDLESVCFARTASPKLGRLESQVGVYPARFSKPQLSASQSSFISYVRTQMAEHDGMRSPGPQSQRSD